MWRIVKGDTKCSPYHSVFVTTYVALLVLKARSRVVASPDLTRRNIKNVLMRKM